MVSMSLGDLDMDKNKQKPTAIFELKGFKVGINDDKNESFTFDISQILRTAPVESITLSKGKNNTGSSFESQEICSVAVTYKFGTTIDEKTISDTKEFIEHFLLIFIVEKEVSAGCVNAKLKSYTVPMDNMVVAHLSESLNLKCEIQIFQLYGKESFNSVLIDEILVEESVQNDFDILKSIYDVENIKSRYLLQYEFLKHLVAELYGIAHGSQILVQKFIVDKYNPQKTDFYKVGITKSLLDPSKDQDYLTYYRNIIGHPPITDDEKSIFQGVDLEQAIVGYSKRISLVILFAIREKKRLGGGTY